MSQIEALKLLISRLERLSVDSYWAHQASGVRGSLLRWLEYIEGEENHSAVPAQAIGEQVFEQLDQLLNRGFYLLERAARERFKDES